MMNSNDTEYMRRAIDLAKAGEGWVHPNPMVGAVIVKDGRIIGEGYHRKCGELHAERNAIADAKRRAGEAAADTLKGATIYVTLEPCCHHGKTPPCTDAIIESRISRVVIGSRDPNPLVAGKGAAILREAGIEVEEDFLKEECDAINPVFFHYIQTKRPYVIMKYAMTADGKIATKTGASQWITGSQAREEVHRLRHACMGIMAGIGTVLADDPMLNCRLEGDVAGPAFAEDGAPLSSADLYGLRQPVRIICDSGLRIPMDSQICRTASEYETIIACAIPQLPRGEIRAEQLSGPDMRELTGPDMRELTGPAMRELPGQEALTDISGLPSMRPAPALQDAREVPKQVADKIRSLVRSKVTVINAAGYPGTQDMGRVNMKELMRILSERGIDSILLEGGGQLNESALRSGIVNEVRAFIAPKVFGGRGKSPVEGTGVELPDEAFRLQLLETRQFGEDLMLRYKVNSAEKA